MVSILNKPNEAQQGRETWYVTCGPSRGPEWTHLIRLLLHSFGDVEKYDDAYAPSGDDEYSKAARRLIVEADLHK